MTGKSVPAIGDRVELEDRASKVVRIYRLLWPRSSRLAISGACLVFGGLVTLIPGLGDLVFLVFRGIANWALSLVDQRIIEDTVAPWWVGMMLICVGGFMLIVDRLVPLFEFLLSKTVVKARSFEETRDGGVVFHLEVEMESRSLSAEELEERSKKILQDLIEKRKSGVKPE